MTENEDHKRMDELWEKRISAIETNHLDLQKDVSSLAKDLGALTASVKSLTGAISTIAQNQTSSLKTNWSVIFAGLGLVVLVAGLVIYEPLNSLQEYHRSHIKDGHPKSVLDKIQADEAKLESRLDRKQIQLIDIEKRLDQISQTQESTKERMLGIERDIYTHASYRAGRPVHSMMNGIKED